MENFLMVISTVATGIATVSIAYYTKKMRDIYKSIELSQNESQERTNDLYQAIVIATLQSSNSSPDVLPNFISEFKRHYTGKTKIF